MHQYQYRQDNVEYVTENNLQMYIRYTCGAIFHHVPKTELPVTRYSTLCETGHKVEPLLKPLTPSSYIFIYLDNVTHLISSISSCLPNSSPKSLTKNKTRKMINNRFASIYG